jgi:hypothetical protein
MFVGRYSIPWEIIGKAAVWFTMLFGTEVVWFDGVSNACVNASYLWNHAVLKQNLRQIQHLLQSTRQFHATEPVDRLYALLNVSNDHRLKADYSLSLVQSFTRAADWLLRNEPGLEVLSMVYDDGYETVMVEEGYPSWIPQWLPHNEPGFGVFRIVNDESDEHREKFPSWVPQWHSTDENRYMIFNMTPWKEVYSSGTTEPTKFRNTDGDGIITMKGLYLSFVEGVGSVMKDVYNTDAEPFRDDILESITGAGLLQNKRFYPAEEEWANILAFALTAGLNKVYKPAAFDEKYLAVAPILVKDFLTNDANVTWRELQSL